MPIDPVTALMIAKAAFGAYQTISGIQDAKNIKRPTQEMPQGVVDAEQMLAELATQTRLPGQDAYEAEVDLDTANFAGKAMSVGGSPADASQILLQGLNESNREKRKLAIEAARYQDQNRARLIEQKNRRAVWEDKLFNINELAPYLDAAKAASAKMGAGITNISNTADSYMGYLQSQDYLAEITGSLDAQPRLGVPTKMSGVNTDNLALPVEKKSSLLIPWNEAPLLTQGAGSSSVGFGSVNPTPIPSQNFDITKALEYIKFFQ
jgi:hypothetical protein